MTRAMDKQRLMLGTAADVSRVVARASGALSSDHPSSHDEGEEVLDSEESVGAGTQAPDGALPTPLLDGGDGELSQ